MGNEKSSGEKKRSLIFLMFAFATFLMMNKTVWAIWTPQEVVSTERIIESEGPSLAVGPDGTVHIAWYDWTPHGPSGIDSEVFYKGLEPGGDWETAETEEVSTERPHIGYNSLSPSLAVGPDGTVHIAWQDWDDEYSMIYDIFYKRLEPGGDWTTAEVVSTESTGSSESPSLAVGSDGTVHIAWWDSTDYGNSDTDSDIYYKRLEPDGDWTTAEVVSTESSRASYNPSLDVGPDGTVHITWYDFVYGLEPYDNVFYKRLEPDGDWTTAEVVSTESTGYSSSPSLGVGPDGTVHIAWTEYPIYDIFYKRLEPDGDWTTAEVVSTSYVSPPSLGVGSDGTVHIAWIGIDYSGLDPEINVVYKRLEPGGDWTMLEVVSRDSTGFFTRPPPSLGVGSDGTVHIAWAQRTDYDDSGNDRDIFYAHSYDANNFLRIVIEGYTEDLSIAWGAKDPSTGQVLWIFGPVSPLHGRLLGSGKIEYVIPFKVTEILPSDEEISLFVEANGWIGTITEFSVTCLGKTFISPDPPVDITISSSGVASVTFLTPPQVLASTGTGKAAFSSSSGTIEDLSAMDEATLPLEGRPSGLEFPDGLFSFTITNLTPGETVTVYIELPNEVPIGSRFWKCHESVDPPWFSIPIESDDGDNIITITLTDGRIGEDSEGSIDGRIVDPGGPAFIIPSIRFPWEIISLAVILGIVTAIIILVLRR